MTKSKSLQRTQEFMDRLAADPAHQATVAAREASRRALWERLRIAEAPLIEALGAVGVLVKSVWDLVNTKARYPAAVPVLLEHFERDYPPEVREGIARALAVPEASWAWDVLLAYFRREPDGGRLNIKWALACALSGAATDDVLDQVIRLVRDPAVGENRLALLSALARSKEPMAREVLEDMRTDKQLSREIRLLLGRKKRGS